MSAWDVNEARSRLRKAERQIEMAQTRVVKAQAALHTAQYSMKLCVDEGVAARMALEAAERGATVHGGAS